MKVIVKRQYYRVGDGYQCQDETQLNLFLTEDDILIETDDSLYFVPKTIFTGILDSKGEK